MARPDMVGNREQGGIDTLLTGELGCRKPDALS
jgi:hypothetical protein